MDESSGIGKGVSVVQCRSVGGSDGIEIVLKSCQGFD